MKKVILLGANGQTAREIIRFMKEQEDVELTLFARSTDRIQGISGPGIRLCEGDASVYDDLKAAIYGKDIVISALGGMQLDKITEGVVNVMDELGVKRIIVISAGGIYDELPEPFNSWDKKMVGHTRPVNLKTAEAVKKTFLNYTVLRPVWLTDKPSTDVELTHKGEVFRGTETSRASLGKFIADLVVSPEKHINEDLGISQPGTGGNRPSTYN